MKIFTRIAGLVLILTWSFNSWGQNEARAISNQLESAFAQIQQKGYRLSKDDDQRVKDSELQTFWQQYSQTLAMALGGTGLLTVHHGVTKMKINQAALKQMKTLKTHHDLIRWWKLTKSVKWCKGAILTGSLMALGGVALSRWTAVEKENHEAHTQVEKMVVLAPAERIEFINDNGHKKGFLKSAHDLATFYKTAAESIQVF